MRQPFETTESHLPLLTLGELAEEQSANQLFPLLQSLREQQEKDPQLAAFFRIGDSFALNEAEQLLLALCLSRYACGREFPEASRMMDFYREATPPEERGELSYLLRPHPDALLLAACRLLLGRDTKLPDSLKLLRGGRTLWHGGALLEELDRFLTDCAADPERLPAIAALTGEEGSGRRFLLAEAAERRGCQLLTVDARSAGPGDAEYIAGLALLYDAMVVITHWHEEALPLLEALNRWFLVLFLTTEDSTVTPPPDCRTLLLRTVEPLSPQERLTALEELFPGSSKKERKQAADTYRMTPGRLKKTAARARAEGPGQSLMKLLQEENITFLSRSAELLRTNKTLKDLVLPPDAKRQIERLCSFAGVRSTVWRQWGFEEKIPYGRGITALFYGASGTGKTLAASVVANELGMPLYRVDLSQLISKYIGETQKNIGQIFDSARNMDCILFFDEADALFARRGENTDAQDRYANAETAYLLQRTEQYDGIILMATNLLQNFDEAFRRRIDFMIHFPLPDRGLREQLWRGIFPPKAPTQDLDFPALAEQLELSGAGIRNCALTAAYLAASQKGPIDMTRVAEAARVEYQKQGKAFPARLSVFLPNERRI